MVSMSATPESTSCFRKNWDSILVVGPNILEIDEFMGVMGTCENSVLETDQYRPFHSSIPSLAFETSYSDVVRLDPVHASYRYLEKKRVEEEIFFCFTLNRNSVSDIAYCFVLKGLELVPGIASLCCIVPVSYVLVLEAPQFETALETLRELKNERLEFMRKFWSGEKKNWNFGVKNFQSEIPLMPPEEWFEAITAWGGKYLLEYSRNDILALLLGVLREHRVMIVSDSQVKRSAIVLCLWAIIETIFPYPHPVLASSPAGISSELPNAPTPMLAGIPPNSLYDRKNGGTFYQTIFAANKSIYALCPEVVLNVSPLFGKGPKSLSEIREELSLFVERAVLSSSHTAIYDSIRRSQAFLLSRNT